jgi:hypothetical protein
MPATAVEAWDERWAMPEGRADWQFTTPSKLVACRPFRLTRRWREPDSNHRSRSCERLFWVANRRRRHERRSHLQVQVRKGNACLEWLPIAFPFAEGPRVRIRCGVHLMTVSKAVCFLFFCTLLGIPPFMTQSDFRASVKCLGT